MLFFKLSLSLRAVFFCYVPVHLVLVYSRSDFGPSKGNGCSSTGCRVWAVCGAGLCRALLAFERWMGGERLQVSAGNCGAGLWSLM